MAADQNQLSEFYIGYFPKAPASYRKKVRLFVIVLLLAVPLIAFLLVRFQRGFIASTYDYAHLTELTGVLINSPFPALQIKINDNQGNEEIHTIPLVAFGKLGGQVEVTRLFQGLNTSQQAAMVTVKGNLIFYDGKTLLEVKEWGEWQEHKNTGTDEPELLKSQVSLTGEVLDAKCFFGVMKPGHGKPHRSCAARCISGGIPPVLAVADPSGEQHYYLITGPENKPVNTSLVPLVAQLVTIKGALYQYHDWEVLQLDQESLNNLAFQPIDLGIATLCSN